MARVVTGSILAGVAAADSYKCPGSAASVHAWSEQTTTIASSCDKVREEIGDRIAGKNGWYDPHNKGHYSVFKASPYGDFELQRKTGDGKYTDKITLEMHSSGDSCVVRGCSESQVSSVLDFSTNFCNIRMLTCGKADGCKSAGFDFGATKITDNEQSLGSSNKMSDCLKVAEEVQDGPRDFSDYSFADFLKEHEKAYEPKELEKRQAIFHSNLAKVVAHNEEYKAGKHTWWATMNHLADFTDDEHRALRATSTYSASQHPVVELTATAPNPPAVDWREKGKVISPVKNQGGCGSCWAFSATETVESHYAIASGKLLTLAPQTYVNCVKNPHQCGGTGGCEGATMELAFNMTRDSGIALEADLPYRGRDEKCAAYKAAVKVTGYVKNPVNDAKALETAVATKGPQAITVAAEPWQLYGGGIFSGCNKPGLFHRKPNIDLDHGVQLVGYTADYWIVRNSWGSFWGEKGYIRISRANDDKLFTDSTPADGVACKPTPTSQTVGGECGILFDTSYPVGVKAAEEAVVV